MAGSEGNNKKQKQRIQNKHNRENRSKGKGKQHRKKHDRTRQNTQIICKPQRLILLT